VLAIVAYVSNSDTESIELFVLISFFAGLFPVTVCQALFIAPCSHSFHYKCIRSTLYDHHPGFSCPLCRSFHNLEADVEVELQEEDEEWEDFPAGDEPNATHIPEPPNSAEVEAEPDPSLAHAVEPAAMDTSDGAANGSTGHVRRSVDDEDDIPLGFRTAAEDNDRRVLLPSNQSHTNVAVAPSNSMSRRPPRRGTMVQGNATTEEFDRVFETDGGVVGYNAETDMDIDEPTRIGNHVNGNHRSNSNSRNGSTRNRATVYNHTSTGVQSGVGSTPNLPRPGSALAHPLSNSTGLSGNTTPPIMTNPSSPQPGIGGAYMSPVNIRSPHALAQSSSNPGAPRGALPGSFGSLPTNSGGSSHLFGDAGAAPPMVPDKDRPHDDAMSGEEHGMESAHPSTLFGFGSKRKR
jgi:hypothetical protein